MQYVKSVAIQPMLLYVIQHSMPGREPAAMELLQFSWTEPFVPKTIWLKVYLSSSHVKGGRRCGFLLNDI